jgi:hypothetical protein
MSKRAKPLSYEEKRRRLAELFYETKDFWTLKEIEKMGSKQKGIVLQSIKEILESLVSDNLVISEKIGTSNYFWSFPSQSSVIRSQKIQSLESDLEALKVKKSGLEDRISAESKLRSAQDRESLLERHAFLTQKLKKIEIALEEYKDRDPATLEQRKIDAKKAKDAANRWTGNYYFKK